MVGWQIFSRVSSSSDRPSIWSVTGVVVALFLLGPFIALFVLGAGDSEGLWPHLMDTVFPRYVANTLGLMAGVAFLSLFFGISTAWVVARCKFPGANFLEWCLILPATVPAYIIGYTYTDFLEYAGPVQVVLRDIFGWQSARDYWFPEIRSMGGAIVVMSAVLYPYIYLLARTAFRLTPLSYYQAASLHNRNFYLSVDLPLARPAIVAGLALVSMEVISDFGTVEYFAIETITLGIFNVWLGMNNLVAAAQIAIFAFIFILGLLFIERRARARQRFSGGIQNIARIPLRETRAWLACLCILICLVPLSLGFILPVGILLSFVIEGISMSRAGVLFNSAINSLTVAALAALFVAVISSIMVLTTSYKNHPILKFLSSVSSAGYAFPGVVLAIGVVSFSGVIENFFGGFIEENFRIGLESFLIGGTSLLIFGYVIRFLAIGHGSMQSGVSRISPNIMNASFVLGHNFSRTMFRLGPPLFRNSLLVAGLLVFVDVMKELPITLLLRPFNFETLSTLVYQFAKDELIEQAAPAALIIVLVGLIPVIIMNASQRR